MLRLSRVRAPHPKYFSAPMRETVFQQLLHAIFRSPDDTYLKRATLRELKEYCRRAAEGYVENSDAKPLLWSMLATFLIHMKRSEVPLTLCFEV